MLVVGAYLFVLLKKPRESIGGWNLDARWHRLDPRGLLRRSRATGYFASLEYALRVSRVLFLCIVERRSRPTHRIFQRVLYS
jgi:hypothetical protein